MKKRNKIVTCDCNYCLSVRYPFIKGKYPLHLKNPQAVHEGGDGYDDGCRAEYKNGEWSIYESNNKTKNK